MRIYLPESISTAFLPKKLQAPASYLIHLLYKQRLYKRYQKDDFVPLMKRHLYSQLGRDHCDDVLDALQAADIIEKDSHYIRGEKSIGYRLSPHLQFDTFRATSLDDKFQLRRLSNWQKRGDQRPAPAHLRANVEMLDLSPNAEDVARAHHEGLLAAGLSREDATMRLTADLYACTLIRSREFYAHCCDYGRVHTNITNISSALRRCLRLDGHALAEVDIVNSQPLFLGILYLRYSSTTTSDSSSCNLNSLSYKIEELFKKEEEGGHQSHYDCTFSIPPSSPGVEKFLAHVQEGTFYDEIQRQLQLTTRDEAKDAFFTLTYGEKRKSNPLKSLYPEVIDFCDWIKDKDYRHLSHALQRAESKCMIWDVSFVLEQSKVWHTTIHDSVLCRPEDKDFVREVITDRIKHLGMTPRLKEKE